MVEQELGGGHKFFFYLIRQLKSSFVKAREGGELNLPEEGLLGSLVLD